MNTKGGDIMTKFFNLRLDESLKERIEEVYKANGFQSVTAFIVFAIAKYLNEVE